MGIAPLILKFKHVPIKRRTSGQVLDEQDHRFYLLNHGFRLFFLCRVLHLSTGSGRSASVLDKEQYSTEGGKNFFDLALFACV